MNFNHRMWSVITFSVFIDSRQAFVFELVIHLRSSPKETTVPLTDYVNIERYADEVNTRKL